MPSHDEMSAQLAQLDNEIAVLSSALPSLQVSLHDLVRDARTARLKQAYLKLAIASRTPSLHFSLWKPGLLFVAAMVAAAACFVISHSLGLSSATQAVGTTFGALAATVSVGVLLSTPGDAAIPNAVQTSALKNTELSTRNQLVTRQLGDAQDRLRRKMDERLQIIESLDWLRASLLQRNWRAMRDAEWENFLVEVFSALGAKAQRTGRTGDQGVDLVVHCRGQSVAVQAKGYYHAVNNKAVQEAVAGRAHYDCDSAAVITNSKFTRSAVERAHSNSCMLIGENEVPDFVMGRCPFYQRTDYR